ncbi:MAG: DUF4375 domain-containing protein [Planctomycetaceae bacterium]|nr:DUF4375 domain-containing protein [Planctomycetaceae bacterium]
MNKNSFLIRLSESDRTAFGRVEFADQTEEQQVFSAIWELESQVNNGGFIQLFTAADGHSANFAPKALRAIKAHKCAEIVTRALRTFSPRDLPIEQAAREELVEALDQDARDALESLDQEFFAYPDKLADLLFDYVRDRPRVGGVTFFL